MSPALTRRAALRGSAAAALGLAASAAPALARPIVIGPDAALIDFAGRVERLVRREMRVRDSIADAQTSIDRWDFANKPQEPRAPRVPSRTAVVDLSTPTHRVMQWSEPREPDPAQVAIDAAYDHYRAACEAHRRAVEARVAGSRVPRLEKLADRMCGGLVRDVDRLADMRPSTPAGLAAKAAAVMAVGERNCGEMDADESRLALSLCEDAVRLFGEGRALRDLLPVPAEEFRALTLHDVVPAGHLAVPVTRDDWMPHLRPGEFAVLDASDAEPQPGELFGLMIGTLGTPRLKIVQPYRSRWEIGDAVMFRFGLPGSAGGAYVDGPLSRRGWRSKCRGRVVGLLHPSDLQVSHGF